MSLNCLTCGPIFQRADSETEYLQEKVSRKVRMQVDRSCSGNISERAVSERDYLLEKVPRKVRIQVDRSWSGNISPPECEPKRGGALANIKPAHHRRCHSTGDVSFSGNEPRLVRSSGMRRDWSFEDLTGEQDNRVRT